MNRDDAVTAVAEALHREACGYTNTHPCSADLTRANIAVAALEPYIAARIAAETEALRREVERLRDSRNRVRAALVVTTAERDEARAALARVEALATAARRNGHYLTAAEVLDAFGTAEGGA